MKNRMELSFKKTMITLIGVGSLIAAMPQSAEATGNRVWTLGVMNRFIEDDANRVLYPHTISKYGNLFYLELYGMGGSLAATAPTSMRGGADGWTNGLNGLQGQTALTGNEFTPLYSTAGGGAIVKLMEGAFLGLHLSDYENPLVKSFVETNVGGSAGGGGMAISGFPWIPGNNNSPESLSAANRKLDLTLAYNVVPDFLTAGLTLSYGSSSYVANPNLDDPALFDIDPMMTDPDELARATDSIGTSETRVLFSAGLDVSESLSAEVGLGIGYHGLTYLPNNRTDMLIGGTGTDFQFDARAMFGLTEWWELIPALAFRTGSFSAVDLADLNSGLNYNNDPGRPQANETDVKTSWMSVDVGIAGHLKPVDFVDFWLATGFQAGSLEYQFEHVNAESPMAMPPIVRDNNLELSTVTYSMSVLPYFKTGLEARIFSWLDLRAGVVKFMREDKVNNIMVDDNDNANNKDNNVTRDNPFFDYFIGLAAHYEGFFLDLQLDPMWIQRGPNFLSGAQGNMFLNGSLGYNF